MTVRRICIDCGRVADPGENRCLEHKAARLAIRVAQARISYRQYRKNRDAVLADATTCALCGRPFTDPADPAEADHIIARKDGGSHHAANLQAVHRSCNLRRGAGDHGGRGRDVMAG